MGNSFTTLTIDGTFYNKDSLLILCHEKINSKNCQEWEKEIFNFIVDWLSSEDIISVNTSGSTGSPKTIDLQKKHMIASAKTTIDFFSIIKNDTIWLCLPVDFIAGKMMIVRAIVGGLNLIYSKPQLSPKNGGRKNIKLVAMVPNQVFNILGDKQNSILEDIEYLLIGGDSISARLEEKLQNHNNIKAWHSYGMTETITHIALRNIGNNSHKGDFYPLKSVFVATNKNNQLLIDYPAIGAHGIVTNDIVRLFDDGSFTILGRIDDVIVSGGIKIHPINIEKDISIFVDSDFFIGGLPDPVMGQKVVLFVEGRYESTNFQKVCDKILISHNKYSVPKQIISITNFSRTKTGKINRKKSIENI